MHPSAVFARHREWIATMKLAELKVPVLKSPLL
jgi:hypothetical protein